MAQNYWGESGNFQKQEQIFNLYSKLGKSIYMVNQEKIEQNNHEDTAEDNMVKDEDGMNTINEEEISNEMDLDNDIINNDEPKKDSKSKSTLKTTSKSTSKTKSSSKSEKVKKSKPTSKSKMDKVHTKHMRSIKKRIQFLGVIIVFLLVFALVLGYYIFNLELDTDNDGIPDINDDDDDGDGIPDSWEVQLGLDPKDPEDAEFDPDGDDLNNHDEIVTYETLHDNSDTDNDKMPDGWEVTYGLNPLKSDGEIDSDQDGYDSNKNGKIDDHELYRNVDEFMNGTNPKEQDSDGDGMIDGWELYYSHRIEKSTGPTDTWLTAQPIKPNPLNPNDGKNDIDFILVQNYTFIIYPDGLTNLEEFQYQTNPIKPDSDQDGLSDFQEIENQTNPLDDDTDSDQLLDGWELRYGGAAAGLDPRLNDTDGDGIRDTSEDLDNDSFSDIYMSNFYESLFSLTSPINNDTDGDFLLDGWEIYYDTNPLIPNSFNDFDNDLLTNREEYLFGTDPTKYDTDDDGLSDGEELLIGFHGILINGTYQSSVNLPRYFTNPASNDTDKDGLLDGEEVQFGEDKFITNATSADSDGDGINDTEEVTYGIDGFITSPIDFDTDHDLLSDKEEIDAFKGITNGYRTIPTDSDFDDDGLLDGEEVLTDFHPFHDFDGTIYGCIDDDSIDGTHPRKFDTDGDGMGDGWEAKLGFAEKSDFTGLIKDFDKNYGITRYGTNYLDLLTEYPEIKGVWLVNPLEHRDKFDDPDDDGFDWDCNNIQDKLEIFSNIEEFGWGTDPLGKDTDSDGMPDGWENDTYVDYGLVVKGPDPTVPDGHLDNDDDGIVYKINNVEYIDTFTNLEEYIYKTHPNNPDTNGDSETDYHEIWYGDADGDGLYNGWEALFNGTPYDLNGFIPHEIALSGKKLDPNIADTDDNNISDSDEDFDNDKWSNFQEQSVEGNPLGSSDPTDGNWTPDSLGGSSRVRCGSNIGLGNGYSLMSIDHQLTTIKPASVDTESYQMLYKASYHVSYHVRCHEHYHVKCHVPYHVSYHVPFHRPNQVPKYTLIKTNQNYLENIFLTYKPRLSIQDISRLFDLSDITYYDSFMIYH